MELQRATFTDLYNARHNPAMSPLKIPIVVLSRGKDTTPKIQAMQNELAKLSGNSIHRTIDGSGAQIQIEQPGSVVSAVAEVLNAARSGKPLN
jgi:pimeloyl-ACP methyl ester carboxylesterase